MTLLTSQDSMSRRHVAPDSARVVVQALENETGRSNLDFIGLEVQDWITRGLQETGLVRVFAGPRGDPASQTPRWASKLEIGTILGGRYYLRGDSIVMQLWVTAPEDGEVVASIGPVTTSLADPTPGIDALRRRAMAVLATHVDPALSQWARSASQPPSFEAYREFSEGKSAFNRDDFQGAVEHYLRASALDSEYVYPLLMAAVLKKDVLGASASADSLVRSVRRHARRLAPFDDALASMLEAQLAGDYDGWYDAAQRLRLYVAPGSDWELEAAAAAVALNRTKEALEIVRGVDLERASATDHWDVFVPIANAYHLAGENETLLAVLHERAKRWPRSALVVVAKIAALAALSRPDEARAEWQVLLGREGEPASLAMWAAWQGARELRAHGSPAAARALVQEALDSLPVLPASSKFGDPALWKMQALREAGHDREALTLAESLSVRQPGDVALTAIVGAISARMGDWATARRIDTTLSTSPVSIDARWLKVVRARLAATLGDRDRAVALVRSACMHGCPNFEDLHSDLEFDALRTYRPFVAMMRQRR